MATEKISAFMICHLSLFYYLCHIKKINRKIC
jgi:hypothetical protein